MGAFTSVESEDVCVRETGGEGCKYCAKVVKDINGNDVRQAWNTILFESDHFVVVPTLGSIVEGWVLIISKAHLICMGETVPETGQELNDVLEIVERAVRQVYGAATVFEHGPNRERLDMGCGIDHAHLHVVPLKFDLLEAAKVSQEFRGTQWHESKSMLSLVDGLYNEGRSYLYIKDSDGAGSYCIPENIPCQSLRRVIARETGKTLKYDYKQHAFKENVLKTIEQLRSVFKEVVGELA